MLECSAAAPTTRWKGRALKQGPRKLAMRGVKRRVRRLISIFARLIGLAHGRIVRSHLVSSLAASGALPLPLPLLLPLGLAGRAHNRMPALAQPARRRAFRVSGRQSVKKSRASKRSPRCSRHAVSSLFVPNFARTAAAAAAATRRLISIVQSPSCRQTPRPSPGSLSEQVAAAIKCELWPRMRSDRRGGGERPLGA